MTGVIIFVHDFIFIIFFCHASEDGPPPRKCSGYATAQDFDAKVLRHCVYFFPAIDRQGDERRLNAIHLFVPRLAITNLKIPLY